VRILKDIVVYRVLSGRAMLLLVCMLMLGACASPQLVKTTPPPLLNMGPEQQVPDVDVLAVSPAMDEFLTRYVLEYSNTQTRLYLLMRAVTSGGVLGFDYDESLTLTASDAFDRRAGNCIGFANMMIALARRAGLKAEYQEVFRQLEWSSHEDTMLLIKHINVVVESRSYTYVLDASGVKINPNTRRRIIGDNYAKALYLNNIGAVALLNNDLLTAHAYLSKAIDTEPQITDPWVNMGVVFGRNEQMDDAEMAFHTALQIDDSEYAALSNLYEVYIAQEDLESAENLQAKVEKYRSKNPYYLLKLSDEALELAHFEESISLLERAIRKKKDDHLLHFALAKTQYLSGEIAAAEGSMIRVRELAPEYMLTYYGQPLDVLIAEE
jgi:tetratricopeptide (TPR) repeat protein